MLFFLLFVKIRYKYLLYVICSFSMPTSISSQLSKHSSPSLLSSRFFSSFFPLSLSLGTVTLPCPGMSRIYRRCKNMKAVRKNQNRLSEMRKAVVRMPVKEGRRLNSSDVILLFTFQHF